VNLESTRSISRKKRQSIIHQGTFNNYKNLKKIKKLKKKHTPADAKKGGAIQSDTLAKVVSSKIKKNASKAILEGEKFYTTFLHNFSTHTQLFYTIFLHNLFTHTQLFYTIILHNFSTHTQLFYTIFLHNFFSSKKREAKMKTVTFALQKGGTGKTTIATSVATELSKKHKVLLIDADPQGNATSWYAEELEAELADALIDGEDAKKCIIKTPSENLHMIPTAGIGGRLKKYQESADAAQSPFAIADIVDKLSGDYDFCVIDTSPACGPIERSCFYASDEIIPVLKLEQFSVDGLEIFMNNLNEAKRKQRLSGKPEVKAIVLNAKDARIAQQNDNMKIFEAMEGAKVFVFPSDTAFGKAQKLHREVASIPNVKKETLAGLRSLADYIEGV